MTTTRPRGAEALSIALVGLDAHLIHIEATASKGSAKLELTGLSEWQARESRVRIRAALQQIGVELNEHAITVRLTPQDLPKSGALDMPMAMAVLGATGHVPAGELKNIVLLGELSLTGALRPVRGVLPGLRGAVAEGITRAIAPRDNAAEAACVPGIRVLVAAHIGDLVRHLRESTPLDSAGEPPPFPPEIAPAVPDMSDIRGMHGARRAMEIAAAGGHDILLIGPPGAGKMFLARRLPGILPPLTCDEALDVTAIHSVAGLLSPERGFIHTRPFRAPHHTVSAAGLVGGGDPVRPGEVTLAHHGVLLLDELAEFKPAVLESLQQPLDEGQVILCRARTRTTFPAQPLLVGAANPCPCGYAGAGSGRCTCSPERMKSYRARLRGPLFARFDMHVVLPPADVAQLQGAPKGESSSEMQKRVITARALRAERKQSGLNSQLVTPDLERFASPDVAGLKVLVQALERLTLSAADKVRVLRVARTIADLDRSEIVRAPHIAEAVHALALASSTNSSTSA